MCDMKIKRQEDIPSLNKQVGGSHYDYIVSPLYFAQANGLDYAAANVIKYVCRHQHKNGKQDLEKAHHYLEFLMEYYYDE